MDQIKNNEEQYVSVWCLARICAWGPSKQALNPQHFNERNFYIVIKRLQFQRDQRPVQYSTKITLTMPSRSICEKRGEGVAVEYCGGLRSKALGTYRVPAGNTGNPRVRQCPWNAGLQPPQVGSSMLPEFGHFSHHTSPLAKPPPAPPNSMVSHRPAAFPCI